MTIQSNFTPAGKAAFIICTAFLFCAGCAWAALSMNVQKGMADPFYIAICLCLCASVVFMFSLLLRATSGKEAPIIRYDKSGVFCKENGTVFIMTPNGETHWVNNGQFIPVQGFRYPEHLIAWHVWRHLTARPYLILVYAALFTVLIVSYYFAATSIPGENPFGEFAIWFIPMLTDLIGYGIILMVAVMLLGISAKPLVSEYMRAKEQYYAPKALQQLLAAGRIDPDILVESVSPEETAAEYKARFLSERAAHGADKFIVAAPFRVSTIAICHPATADDMEVREVLESRKLVCPSAPSADNESWEDYQFFLELSRSLLKSYCLNHRATTTGAINAMFVGMKAVCLIGVLLLCSLSAQAQSKTERLTNHLAERAFLTKPKEGSAVKYSFQAAPITRTGDGHKNLMELLKSSSLFTDTDNAGPLLAVYVDGKIMNPDQEGGKVMVSKSEVGTGSVVPIPDGKKAASFLASLPDSAELSAQIYRWKGDAMKANRKFMFVSLQYWDYFSWWLHLNVFPFLVIMMSVLGLISRACSSEFIVGKFGNTVVGGWFREMHKYSSALFMFSLLVFGVVVVVDILTNMIASGRAWWELALVGIFMSFIVGRFLGWLTPNAKVQGGGNNVVYENQMSLPR